jgi:hypothetical protein
MIVEGRVRLLGVVRQELLSGIRHKVRFDRVATALRTFEDVELEIPEYEEAAVADNRCRSSGLTGSTTDFLIYARPFAATEGYLLLMRTLPDMRRCCY